MENKLSESFLLDGLIKHLRPSKNTRILPQNTLKTINDIVKQAKVGKGVRALFYGPPGTGKTFTATLLGRKTGRDVYRIDLAGLVSKYIGETEKNLHKVLSHAEASDAILFFDEADALFGNRSAILDTSNANIKADYLLKRMETHKGIIIFSANKKEGLASRLLKRINYIIDVPSPQKRIKLKDIKPIRNK